jgi:hypothetical protein
MTGLAQQAYFVVHDPVLSGNRPRKVPGMENEYTQRPEAILSY